jgi:hypothetical protein
MAMVEWNMSEDTRYHRLFDFNEPILIIDHHFKIVENPNDYSLTESMMRLHSIFKNRCRDALAAIRLTSSKRIGLSYVYHVDLSWSTISSFKSITEDPSPVYRPLRFGKHSMRKDEFFVPWNVILNKKQIIDTFEAINKLFKKASANTHYSHLSTAIDFYSKCMEDYDSGWALLDLVILLESLCYFRL